MVIHRERSTPAHRDGVTVRRTSRLREAVLWHVGPPRQRYEDAVLDLAEAAADELAAVAVVARACGSRRTTAAHLLEALGRRSRVSGRRWLTAVVGDVAAGTCSVLEHGYLTRVERPHGLPRPIRQLRDDGRVGVIYRDASFEGAGHLELDGRLGHTTTEDRDRDLDRDLLAAAVGGASVRLSYGQVFRRACWTAAQVDRWLVSRGLATRSHPCSAGCPVGATARQA